MPSATDAGILDSYTCATVFLALVALVVHEALYATLKIRWGSA